jgi:hypothetical protein
MSRYRLTPILLAILALGGAAHTATRTWASQVVPAEFILAVNEYVELHRAATAALVPPQMCSDADQLLRQEWTFARAIGGARPDAREGDVFNPVVAAYFRTLIRTVASERGYYVFMEEDAEAAVLEVNGAFPWSSAPVMWPEMLARLPELPPELEYRFVGPDLVLVYTFGNTVVDVLREALPAVETESSS